MGLGPGMGSSGGIAGYDPYAAPMSAPPMAGLGMQGMPPYQTMEQQAEVDKWASSTPWYGYERR